MTPPTVCAVMLTADRQEMTARAVRSFLAQDYQQCWMMVVDSSKAGRWQHEPRSDLKVRYTGYVGSNRNIGALRNHSLIAVVAWVPQPDIFIHFDSDDWSAPTRISDQVKLLVESGKQAVGYREMLFWRRPYLLIHHPSMFTQAERESGAAVEDKPGEAWLYSNTDTRYSLATSLCYWRKTWEVKPFPDAMIGSEREWLKGLDTLGVAGVVCDGCDNHEGTLRVHHRVGSVRGDSEEPLLVATIHGGNTVKNQIVPAATNPDGSKMWTRVPAWDRRVRSILEAA